MPDGGQVPEEVHQKTSASTSGHIGVFFRWIRLMPHIENPTNPNFWTFVGRFLTFKRIETQVSRDNLSTRL